MLVNAIWSPFRNNERNPGPIRNTSILQNTALGCRAPPSISLEIQQFSAGFFQADFLVTNAHLRMGLTQHTGRSLSCMDGKKIL